MPILQIVKLKVLSLKRISIEWLNICKRFLKRLVIKPDDNHWVTFGLLPKTDNTSIVIIKEKFVVNISLLYVTKNLISIGFGWDRQWFLKYSADLMATFQSKAIWFYFNVTFALLAISIIVLPTITRKFWSPSLQDFFTTTKGCIFPSNDLNMKNQMMLFVKRCFKLFNYFLSVYVIFEIFLFLFFVYNNLETVLVFAGFLSFLIFLFIGYFFTTRFLVPNFYFAIICFYARLKLEQQISIVKTINNREFIKVSTMNLKITNTLKEVSALYRSLAVANRLFRHLSSIEIALIFGFSITSTFAITYLNSSVEKLIFIFPALNAVLAATTYFIFGNLIVVKSNRLYNTLNCFMARNAILHTKVALPIRTRWHLLLMVEYLASKRGRVGFSCLHWFRLCHFSLLKVFPFNPTNH